MSPIINTNVIHYPLLLVPLLLVHYTLPTYKSGVQQSSEPNNPSNLFT